MAKEPQAHIKGAHIGAISSLGNSKQLENKGRYGPCYCLIKLFFPRRFEPTKVGFLRRYFPHQDLTTYHVSAINTPHRDHCATDLQFDWYGFDPTCKTVFHSTYAKQLNPNKIDRRSVVHCDSCSDQ